MAPGRLGWQQGIDTWHQGGWDGNRAWSHGTSEAGMSTGSGTRVTCMATVPGHIAPGWLGWHGNMAWPHGTREAGMAAGPGHIAPGRLGWQQGQATWHQGGLYGYIASRMAPGWLGWQQGQVTWHQGGLDGNRSWQHDTRVAGMATGYSARPHGTTVAGMATGSGRNSLGRLG